MKAGISVQGHRRKQREGHDDSGIGGAVPSSAEDLVKKGVFVAKGVDDDVSRIGERKTKVILGENLRQVEWCCWCGPTQTLCKRRTPSKLS